MLTNSGSLCIQCRDSSKSLLIMSLFIVLVCGQEFIGRSEHARLQVSVCSGDGLCHPA